MTTKTYGGYTVEQLRRRIQTGVVTLTISAETVRDLLDAVESGEREAGAVPALSDPQKEALKHAIEWAYAMKYIDTETHLTAILDGCSHE